MDVTEVLIADDSVLILKMIKKALLSNVIEGHHFIEEKIYTAQNGMEAFEMLGKNKNISLLISDINMPVLNGDELIEVLVDTGLYQNIQTVFITSSESLIKCTTKKHTIGTIKKPFNANSFNTALNQLLKRDKLTKIQNKHQLKKQITTMEETILQLFEHYKISEKINDDQLNNTLKAYFNQSDSIDDSELELIFYSIVDELLQLWQVDLSISQSDLKSFLHQSSQKNFHYTLALQECLYQSIANTKILLEEKKEAEVQFIINELAEPIEGKVRTLKQKVINFPPKNFAMINPQIEQLLPFFEALDPTVKDDYAIELIASKEEIIAFCDFIHSFCSTNKLKEELSQLGQLTNVDQLFQTVYARYTKLAKILTIMLNHIIGELEDHLMYRALTSKPISSYFKKAMPSQLPTTNNILLQLKRISPIEHKKLIKNDSQNLVILSKNIDLLRFFKEEYEKLFPTTTLFCFTKVSLLENWLKTKRVDKLIIDYDFSDNVFNTGAVFLKYFIKKNSTKRTFRALFRYQRYYTILTQEQILKEREILHALDTHIIEKPLCKTSLKSTLVYS